VPQVQGYNPLPVTPPPVNNIARRPTGPMPAVARPVQQQAPAVPVMQEAARQPMHAMQQMPAMRDNVSDDDYDLGDDVDDMEELMPPVPHARLPVPEPEAQPAQRPAADSRQQRPIRRMDPKALDLPRGTRNAPPGDVIDIPAFLRKR
jgi:cell division protein FtsZ